MAAGFAGWAFLVQRDSQEKVQCTQSLPLKYYCTLASSRGVSIMALDVEAAAPAINTRLQQYITN